jgi:hypothetical protein
MHPEIARRMVAEQQANVAALAGPIGQARSRRQARGLPRWHVTWSRMASPGGRSWMIVISSHRTVRPAA